MHTTLYLQNRVAEIPAMENNQDDLCVCPSFNSYSTNRLPEIAVNVAAEMNEMNSSDEDFEFSLVRDDKVFSADDFAFNNQIGPIFPVFNRDLPLSNEGRLGATAENKRLGTIINVPMGKLFLEDYGDNPQSCSSSENDELENIPSGTYCIWRPKAADLQSPSRCKKSKSTGSASKRWKLLDLLRRSNSEGKYSFVFLTPQNREEKLPAEVLKKGKGKGTPGSSSGPPLLKRSPHEALYVRNRTIKEENKKKTYLPYRQDLVGFFVNVNVLGKSLPHP